MLTGRSHSSWLIYPDHQEAPPIRPRLDVAPGDYGAVEDPPRAP
jgi:hypothetical protein